MKLTGKGEFWIWDEPSRETDLAVMALQKKYKHDGLSIWGTPSCQKCGACCYKFGIPTIDKPQYQVCQYQTCTKQGSSCERNGPRKPWGCKLYGCWNKRIAMGTDAERLQLIRMAVDILKTKTEIDMLELIVRDNEMRENIIREF